MQFDLDEDVALLKQSTRELLEREAPLAQSRPLMEGSEEGYSKALYAQLAVLGYLGLALPEEAGGAGIGTVALAAVLEEMGCKVIVHAGGVTIEGRPMKGKELDLNAIPDALPALAVTACFAEGTTRLVNVPQARLKETDRISVMCGELAKMGVEVTY